MAYITTIITCKTTLKIQDGVVPIVHFKQSAHGLNNKDTPKSRFRHTKKFNRFITYKLVLNNQGKFSVLWALETSRHVLLEIKLWHSIK